MKSIAERCTVHLEQVYFPDDELTSNWYTGLFLINVLLIDTNRLNTIHANAFNIKVFQQLKILILKIRDGWVTTNAAAFNGLPMMQAIKFIAKRVKSFAANQFDPVVATLQGVEYECWPNEINVNEMFARGDFRVMKVLSIKNLQLPQTKFRCLAAENFTAFRHLEILHFVNCGIEVIQKNALQAIGHSLKEIDLDHNRIKFIHIDMFRTVFESRFWTKFSCFSHKEMLECTCDLVEMDVMRCPFRTRLTEFCSKCMPPDHDFVASSCAGIYRDMAFTKFGRNVTNLSIMRIIRIRMAYDDTGSISIKTNFTGKIRLIFADAQTKRPANCRERASPTKFKCLNVKKFVGDLKLDKIDGMRDLEFVSVTAIPILLWFGTRPMHAMTVRQRSTWRQHKAAHGHDEQFMCCLQITMVSIFFGAFVGFGCGFCRESAKEQWKISSCSTVSATARQAHRRRSSYYYITPQQANNIMPAAVVEANAVETYVEVY